MAIGVNWAEIWVPVWDPVWTQTPPIPPTPDEQTVTPAGSSRKRKYFVEIDGQHFQVNTEAEAVQVLQQARALAERQAEVRADRAVKLLRRKETVPKVRIAVPQITASPEVRQAVAPLIADINRLYNKAAELAELRLLLAKRMAEEDEAEDELLLLL